MPSRRKLQASTVHKVCTDVLRIIDSGLHYDIKWSRDDLGIGVYEVLVDNLHRYEVLCPDLDDPEGIAQQSEILDTLQQHALSTCAKRTAELFQARGCTGYDVVWWPTINAASGVLMLQRPSTMGPIVGASHTWPCPSSLVTDQHIGVAFATLVQCHLADPAP